MEDFTLTELKNIAREERLSGWSTLKKEDLFNFLVSNNVDVKKYQKQKKCIKKTKTFVVKQALEEDVQVLNTNLNVKTKKELCKNISKKVQLRKKEDLVQQALGLNIDINKPNGKPKTSKELLEDITLKLITDEQVDVLNTPYQHPQTSKGLNKKSKKEDLVQQALGLNIDINKPNGKPKTIKELLEDISLKVMIDKQIIIETPDQHPQTTKGLNKKSKKEDLVQQALGLNIDINKPNGKPKTIKELLEDISLKVMIDKQIIIETPVNISYQPSAKCLKRVKKDVVVEALSLGINIAHPNGKVKTVKELCTEIELLKASQSFSSVNINAQNTYTTQPDISTKTECIITPNGTVECSSEQKEEISTTTECIITDEGAEVCLKTQPDISTTPECIITPNGTVECSSEQKEEICVVSNVCATDPITGEETCAPVQVCAKQKSTLIPVFSTRRNVDMTDIEKSLTELSDPTASNNQNIIVVKETVYRALGLI